MTNVQPKDERLIDLNKSGTDSEIGEPALPRPVFPYDQPAEQPHLRDVTGSGSFSDTGVHVKPSGSSYDDIEYPPMHAHHLQYDRPDWMRHPLTSVIAFLLAAFFCWLSAWWIYPRIDYFMAQGEYDHGVFAALLPILPWCFFVMFRRSVTTLWWDDDSYVGAGTGIPHYGGFFPYFW